MTSDFQAGFYLDPAASSLLEQSRPPRRALFLDRDGVINIDHGYVHTPDQTDWVPGVFDMCSAAKQVGYLLVVVTNQAGIARGLYSEATFLEYTRWVHQEFARRGVPLSGTFYCPHHPEGSKGIAVIQCECRKPAPGMILQAARALGADPEGSILIGDKSSDIEAGLAAGVALNILFGSHYEGAGGGRTEQSRTMAHATNLILDRVNNQREQSSHVCR